MSVSRISETLGAILTGGESRRMGRDKALLEWHGMSLLDRAAGTMTELFSEVIVCGDPDRHSHVNLDVVADRRRGIGPLAGLATVLERSGERSVFVLACDLARVTPELIEHVISAATPTDPASAPAIDGLVQPLCGLYRPLCRNHLAAFLANGGRRALGFFEEIGGGTVSLTSELPFFAPDLLLNLNRPEDLGGCAEVDQAGDGRPGARG